MRFLLGLGMAALAGCNTAEAERLMKGEPPPLTGSLEGGPWLVEDVNGGGVIDSARLEISFDPGDHNTSRVSGRAGCNRFSGAWTQNGTRVKFGPFAATKMACAPALMQLETKFLSTLGAVTTLAFDPSGAALLKSPSGESLKLRREASSF